MSKLMRRRSVYNTTTGTARAPGRWRFDLLNTYLMNEPGETFLLTVVRFAVDGFIVNEDRNRWRGRRSDGLVGEVTVPGGVRGRGLVVTVTDAAGHSAARRDADFSSVAGAGVPGAGRGRRSRSAPIPGRRCRTDPGSAVQRRRAGSTRAR